MDGAAGCVDGRGDGGPVLTQTAPTFVLAGSPFLEYLPVVDLSNGRLLGMEALVRWQHPTQGLISPNQLIPYAEENGDIGPLTRWIVMEACEQACSWSPSIQLGVNCTIHQLRRGEVSNAVAAALEQTGFRSGQLTLEVTEDAIVDPAASADLKDALADGCAAVGGRRRHQLVVVRAVQAALHQHRQDRRLVHRRPRVDPGDQPAGGGDGDPHGPLPRDVGHRRGGGDGHAGGDRPVVQRRRRPGILLRPPHVGRARRLPGRRHRGSPVLPHRDPDHPAARLVRRRS